MCTAKFDVVEDQAQVVNWIGIAAKGGNQKFAVNEWSKSFYGVKSTHRNDLIHAEGDSWSQWIADQFLSRVNRTAVVVTPLVFDALRDAASWDAAHYLDIGDRVAVHRQIDGHHLDVTSTIDEIRHDITPTTWRVQIKLAPGTQRRSYPRWGRARWGRDKWG